MKTIEVLASQLLQEMQSLQIDDDEFNSWKNNRTTKRIMAELNYSVLQSFLDGEYSGAPTSADELALKTSYVKGIREAFDLVLSWEPESLTE